MKKMGRKNEKYSIRISSKERDRQQEKMNNNEKDNKIKGNQEEGKRYQKIIEGEKRESENEELSE